MSDMMLSDSTPVARKPHTCGLCGLEISVDQRYYCQTIAHDGTVGRWRSHERCWGLIGEYERWLGIDDDPWRWMDGIIVDHDEFREFAAAAAREGSSEKGEDDA